MRKYLTLILAALVLTVAAQAGNYKNFRNTAYIVAFLAYIVRRDLPLSSLPMVGKYFRK